jgi:hypothetical protein
VLPDAMFWNHRGPSGALASGRSASDTAIPLTRHDRHRHKRKRPMGSKLVDYLLYEPEDNGDSLDQIKPA